MTMKICGTCKKEMEDNFENFTRANTGKTSNLCKECKSKYDKEYREKNKVRIAKRRKEYEENNKERIREKCKIWTENNKEHIKEYKKKNAKRISENYKKWRKANSEHCKIRKRNWYMNNKDHVVKYRIKHKGRDRQKAKEWFNTERGNALRTAATRRRRAKIESLKNTFSNEDWEKCKEYFDNKCAYCGEIKPLERDHVIPVNVGGKFIKKNILPSCKYCNCKKGINDFYEWYKNYDFYNEKRLEKIERYLREIK